MSDNNNSKQTTHTSSLNTVMKYIIALTAISQQVDKREGEEEHVPVLTTSPGTLGGLNTPELHSGGRGGAGQGRGRSGQVRSSSALHVTTYAGQVSTSRINGFSNMMKLPKTKENILTTKMKFYNVTKLHTKIRNTIDNQD